MYPKWSFKSIQQNNPFIGIDITQYDSLSGKEASVGMGTVLQMKKGINAYQNA